MAKRKRSSRCSCGMGKLSQPRVGQRVVFDPGEGAEDRYRREFVFPGMRGTLGQGSASGWTPAPYCNQERTLVEVHWDAGRTTCVPPRFLSPAQEGRKGLGDKERPAGQHYRIMQDVLFDAKDYRRRGDWRWYSQMLRSASEQAAHLDWHARQGEKIPFKGFGAVDRDRFLWPQSQLETLPRDYVETYDEMMATERSAVQAGYREDVDTERRYEDKRDELMHLLEEMAEQMTEEQKRQTRILLKPISVRKHHPGLGGRGTRGLRRRTW